MKPLVIYHANCTDGHAAAFAAWLKLGDDAEYLPMQYGDKSLDHPFDLREMVIDREATSTLMCSMVEVFMTSACGVLHRITSDLTGAEGVRVEGTVMQQGD